MCNPRTNVHEFSSVFQCASRFLLSRLILNRSKHHVLSTATAPHDQIIPTIQTILHPLHRIFIQEFAYQRFLNIPFIKSFELNLNKSPLMRIIIIINSTSLHFFPDNLSDHNFKSNTRIYVHFSNVIQISID